jgi:hypothetical protein
VIKTPTHFLTGEPIPQGYLEKLQIFMNEVHDAEAHIPIDELEEYANTHRTTGG